MKLLCSILLGWIGISAPRSAVAQQAAAEVSIRWDAPKSCPGHEYIVRKLEEYVGENAGMTLRSSIQVVGTVKKTSTHAYSLKLVTRQDQESWERPALTSSSCAELADFTALVAAYLVDPELALDLPVDASDASAGERGEADPVEVVLAEEEPPEEASLEPPDKFSVPRRSAFALIRAGLTIEHGAFPGKATFGPGAAIGVGTNRFRMEIGGLWIPKQLHRVASAPNETERGATMSLAAGHVGGCYTAIASLLHFGACVRGQAGSVYAEAFGISTPQKGRATWLALGAGPEVSAPLSNRFWIRGNTECYFPLGRSRFLIDGLGPIHQLPVSAYQLALAGEVRFD